MKEQTAVDYAQLLVEVGFYALMFDTGYQSESTGEPHGLEGPPPAGGRQKGRLELLDHFSMARQTHYVLESSDYVPRVARRHTQRSLSVASGLSPPSVLHM